jgi:hypothetical protein
MLKWAVQTGVFWENERQLKALLGDRFTSFEMTINGPSCDLEPPFICYGSIPACRRLQKKGAFSWVYDNVFDCNYYLPKLSRFALNADHLYIEAGCFHQVMKALGNPRVFIKENSGYKTLSGQVTDKLEEHMLPHELLLLAPPKAIGAEWRFVISDGKVLTGSLYSDIKSERFDEAAFFAQSVIDQTELDPAPVWTIDICESENSLKVVEINSLMSAGWYESDVAKIVAEVDRLANLSLSL